MTSQMIYGVNRTVLTGAEESALDAVAELDELSRADYYIDRGPRSGHAIAVNGFSMAYDLTAEHSVDADSVEEADDMLAAGTAITGD
jgi:hypothetical protein